MDEKVKELVIWICNNTSKESIFLTPDPQHHVHTDSLILEVEKIWAIDSYDMRHLVNSTAEKIEAKKDTE